MTVRFNSLMFKNCYTVEVCLSRRRIFFFFSIKKILITLAKMAYWTNPQKSKLKIWNSLNLNNAFYFRHFSVVINADSIRNNNAAGCFVQNSFLPVQFFYSFFFFCKFHSLLSPPSSFGVKLSRYQIMKTIELANQFYF